MEERVRREGVVEKVRKISSSSERARKVEEVMEKVGRWEKKEWGGRGRVWGWKVNRGDGG